MAQGNPPFTQPSPMGTRNPPPLDPLSGRLGLRDSSVKLEILNAFYEHSHSVAHPKPWKLKMISEKRSTTTQYRFLVLENLSC